MLGALVCGCFLRVAAVVYHNTIAPLPDGTADALMFQDMAESWATLRWGSLMSEYPGPGSAFYSWLLAIMYWCFDVQPVLGQLLSVACGTLSVALASECAFTLWRNRDAALRTAWCVAVFPTIVQYSALTMRETFIQCAFLVGAIQLAKFINRPSAWSLISSAVAIITAGFFHGAFFIALPIVGVLSVLLVSSARVSSFAPARHTLLGLVAVCAAAVLVGVYLRSGVEVPYLGEAESFLDEETLVQRMDGAARDGARYPDWLVPTGVSSLLITLGPRFGYFWFSPFVWDVRSASHIAGLVDGTMYIGLAILMWSIRRRLYQNRAALAVLLLTMALALIYAIGTSNFGTGIRHRAKFAPVLIALSAPALLGSSRSKEAGFSQGRFHPSYGNA